MRYLLKFSQQVRDFTTSVNKDSKLSAIALSKYLADNYVIPPTPVEDIEEFFAANCKDRNYCNLDYIVGCSVIDINLVEEYNRIFWMVRYRAIHPKPIMATTKSGILDVLGVASLFSENDLVYIGANSEKIAFLYNGFARWFTEISKIEAERKTV